jgi:hypothetical protein
MVREPRPSGRDALSGYRVHQLTVARTHDIPDLPAGNCQPNDGGSLGYGLRDLWFVEHGSGFLGACYNVKDSIVE